MSHFVVLVIGDNIEDQLLPYHEFESTGQDDLYIQDIDITEEAMKNSDGDPVSYYEYEKVTDLDDLDYEDLHKYGYVLVDDQDNIIKVVQRTNPNAQWDWWSVGGRWSNWLKGTDGLPFSSGPKSSIAFDLIRSNAEEEAGKGWDNAHKIIAGRHFFTFEECREKFTGVQEARDFYFDQAPVKEAREFDIWLSLDNFRDISREEYVTTAGKNSAIPFAFVKDGKWYQRGEMGWFGMSTEQIEKVEWADQVNAMLDSLSDNALITVVDCHI